MWRMLPTHSMPGPTPPVWLRLSAPEIAALDRIARAKGYSRSELLRLLIRQGLPYAGNLAPKDFGPSTRPHGSAGLETDPPAERAPPAA